MLNAGVRMKGHQILPGLQAQAARVECLKNEFRDLTEAYLVEFLIAKLGDISTRDHRALACVLPPVRSGDLDARSGGPRRSPPGEAVRSCQPQGGRDRFDQISRPVNVA